MAVCSPTRTGELHNVTGCQRTCNLQEYALGSKLFLDMPRIWSVVDVHAESPYPLNPAQLLEG
eukprot:4222244-Prorocentrum_lima.AAC.1